MLGTVIHYTGAGDAAGSVRWFHHPDNNQSSAHFIISRSGLVTQMVEVDRKAWHAGVGEMEISGEMEDDPNLFTVGVELANWGLLYRDKQGSFFGGRRKPKRYYGASPDYAELTFDNDNVVAGWWEPYRDAQMDSLQTLLRRIAKKYPYAASNLIGHEEIGMPLGRKVDPGPLFPWERFQRRLGRRTSSSLVAA